MKVSIITATYNSAQTIRDSLESVASQTYADIEHIIVDGASTDKTLEIVKQFPHVTKIISERDQGIYDAMNKGICIATGDVIGILNSDDYYIYPNVINEIIQKLVGSQADSIYADLDYVDGNDSKKVLRRWQSKQVGSQSFRFGWMPPHPTFFVKKKLYDKFGRFNLEMGTAADYELMLRFLERYKCSVVYLPKTIIHMRAGGASNATLSARLKANKMDHRAWEINGLKPGLFTFLLKPLRKVFQYL